MAEYAFERVTGLEPLDANKLFILISNENWNKEEVLSIISSHMITSDNLTLYFKGEVVDRLKPSTSLGNDGVIFHSVNNPSIVYKRQSIKYKNDLQDILRELIIQVILSSDPDVGNAICKPRFMLYEQGFIYIAMDYHPFTFNQYYKKPDLILNTLEHILSILLAKYNFNHGDLYGRNILVADDGTLKLIDFRTSSLIYNGLHYGVPSGNDDIEWFKRESEFV